MKRHEHHDCAFKIKGGIDPAGTFTGVAAAYTEDLGGDRLVPGAFTRTLAASKQYPLLYQHQAETPIGTVTVTDSPSGLLVTGQLLMDLEAAKTAYILIKNRVIKGLSIGYETIQDSLEDGVRILKEVRLWEVSIVTFPMNLDATIGSVKSLSADEMANHLRAIDTHRKAIARHVVGIQAHLKSMLGFDDEDADDPGLDDDDNDEDDDDKGAFLDELKQLVEQAEGLARK